MARLSGTGRLADDLYLMAHHEVTGRPLLQPRAVGLGLAGAPPAELMLAGQIRIWPDGFVAADSASPEDRLARDMLGQVAGEHERHPARDWLAFLARTAASDVARRLERSGYLTRACARWPWRGERWVPVDADCAFAPLTRVKSALDPSRPVTAQGAVLARLAAACGLGSRLSLYLPPGTGRGH
jgi:Golgi phosphoprotein 3 (GPP34)